MQNKIAKKVFLSFLRSSDNDLYRQHQYAINKSNIIDNFFEQDKLVNDIVKFRFFINPHDVLKTAIDKEIQVNAILFYANNISKNDYIKGLMHSNYSIGIAEYCKYRNKHYIVVYGSSNKKDYCYNKKFFKTSFTHELIHLLDSFLYKDELKEKYSYGHPINNFLHNGGVPFPGMFGKNDNIYNQIFAEYYTCKAERREYIYDLINLIEQYSQYSELQEHTIVEKLLNALNDKNDFLSLSKQIQKSKLNYSPLALIYHLTFSKQKNGNKHDAIKILKDLL